jgi:FkbM family methyltransferase
MREILLNNDKIVNLLKNDKLVVIDGGARGTVFKPMNLLKKSILQVIRFEPDADANIINDSDDIVISKALWNKSQSIKVNIAIEPSSSSVYPFNERLQKYIDPQVNTRKTKKEVVVDAMSIDECLKTYNIKGIDFIKLDIHGAEYETLEGASEVLRNTLGLLIESWVVPVHIGQKTRGDVERLALDNGFYVFEENVVAKWGRKPNLFLKRQPIAVDTLFFKDTLLNDIVDNEIKLIKLIGLADLFNHHGFALQLLEYAKEGQLISTEILQVISSHLNESGKVSLKDKIRAKLIRILSESDDCAFR